LDGNLFARRAASRLLRDAERWKEQDAETSSVYDGISRVSGLESRVSGVAKRDDLLCSHLVEPALKISCSGFLFGDLVQGHPGICSLILSKDWTYLASSASLILTNNEGPRMAPTSA